MTEIMDAWRKRYREKQWVRLEDVRGEETGLNAWIERIIDPATSTEEVAGLVHKALRGERQRNPDTVRVLMWLAEERCEEGSERDRNGIIPIYLKARQVFFLQFLAKGDKRKGDWHAMVLKHPELYQEVVEFLLRHHTGFRETNKSMAQAVRDFIQYSVEYCGQAYYMFDPGEKFDPTFYKSVTANMTGLIGIAEKSSWPDMNIWLTIAEDSLVAERRAAVVAALREHAIGNSTSVTFSFGSLEHPSTAFKEFVYYCAYRRAELMKTMSELQAKLAAQEVYTDQNLEDQLKQATAEFGSLPAL